MVPLPMLMRKASKEIAVATPEVLETLAEASEEPLEPFGQLARVQLAR